MPVARLEKNKDIQKKSGLLVGTRFINPLDILGAMMLG